MLVNLKVANQVMSGMDLVPPNNDQVYIDLTGESSDDEPPLGR